MGKFLLGLLIGIVVAIFGLFVIVLALGRVFRDRQPTVPGNSALVLQLEGDLPETAPKDLGIPFIQQRRSPTVRDLWTSFKQAAKDNRVKAVVLEPKGIAAGWGRLQELRAELLDFKKSGKPVYAYLQSPGSREYYLASAADRVFLSPGDMLGVKGFLLEASYLKGFLDKIGVQFEVDHIGRYKDAGDIFTRSDMSPETREVLGQVLDQIYGEFCSSVGQSRHKSAADVRNLVDIGPFTSDQAKANNLVDVIGYEDELYGDLEKKTGANLRKFDIRNYYRAVPGRGDRIAVLAGSGEITQGDNSGNFGDVTGIADESFTRVIHQVRDDSSIKGVILRVNSPGGDALASDVILHELKLLSAKKPVVVSMSDLAASGGYYISMTGDPVIAYPNTITGSIGVVYARPIVGGLLDKLGIQDELITRGKMADMDSPSKPLSDAARQKVHQSIEATYKLFVTKVASARRKPYDQIDSVAQGRVWMGNQARQNGLVDELGGLDQAVASIRRRSHLPESGETNLVLFPPRRTLLEMLSESSPDAMQDAFAESKLRKLLPNLPSENLLKGGLLRILPYSVTVH